MSCPGTLSQPYLNLQKKHLLKFMRKRKKIWQNKIEAWWPNIILLWFFFFEGGVAFRFYFSSKFKLDKQICLYFVYRKCYKNISQEVKRILDHILKIAKILPFGFFIKIMKRETKAYSRIFFLVSLCSH